MIKIYKNVFDRKDPKDYSINEFFFQPSKILKYFSRNILTSEPLFLARKITEIELESIKEVRNETKRTFLPAADFSNTVLFSIDIDNVSHNFQLKKKLVDKLSALPSTFVVQESVSKNLVAFFKWNGRASDYPLIYYKHYLEMTLLLGVQIDYLPELNRLRYVSINEPLYFNVDSDPVIEKLEGLETPPYITSVTAREARKLKYKSA